MGKELKVVTFDEVEPTILPGEGAEVRRLVTKRRENSERMSFGVCTFKKGYDEKSVYEDKDEIMYLLEGKAIISWKGGEAEVKPGMAMFIPAGVEYRYQVLEGNLLLGILSPPRE